MTQTGDVGQTRSRTTDFIHGPEKNSRPIKVPPPLPAMDDPNIYVLHSNAMENNTRKNYVHDRMRAALIYISEYAETRKMMTENRYMNEELLTCLRAVFWMCGQNKKPNRPGTTTR